MLQYYSHRCSDYPISVPILNQSSAKHRQQRESIIITAVLENVISGISVVQAYNAQDWEAKRVDEESTAYRDQAIGARKEEEILTRPLWNRRNCIWTACYSRWISNKVRRHHNRATCHIFCYQQE